MTDIASNLGIIKERIRKACEKVGRNPDSVRLLAVAKTKPPSMVKEAIECGQSDIGENYVQELLKKIDEIDDPNVRWHFIGHLQSNKVRQIVGKVAMIHSVDRLSLLKEIEKRAAKIDKVVNCLIEVNVGSEESKSGIEADDLKELLQYSKSLEHVKISGLMSIPPFLDDPEDIRPYHQRLAGLAGEMRNSTGMELPELSMGMSLDFEQAIEEGATIVRVGTDIFGARTL